MKMARLLIEAREAAGLTQAALAQIAGTSRTTLSAYEHGRKSPVLETAERIVQAAGCDLVLARSVVFEEVEVGRGRTVEVPRPLPRLPLEQAFATVELPVHLNWSDRGRTFDLADRRQRARVYEIVLREGVAVDVLTYVDGALLIDLWDELVLPHGVRRAWETVAMGRGEGEAA